MELLLDALGSCQAIAINAFAPKFKVKIKKLDIHVEGDIDLGGFLGTNSARPGYQRLRSTIDLDADGDPDAVNRLIEYVEAHCPVGALSLTGCHHRQPKIVASGRIGGQAWRILI